MIGGDGRATAITRLIVIDSANVLSAGDSLSSNRRPSLPTLISAVHACKRAGLATISVLPMGMERLTICATAAETDLLTAWLAESQRCGELLHAPCRISSSGRALSDDDLFAIALAVRRDAFLLSNDRFADHAPAIARDTGVPVSDVTNWLLARVVTFGVVGGEVIPHPLMLAKAMRHIPGSGNVDPSYVSPHSFSQSSPPVGSLRPARQREPLFSVNISIAVPAERVGAIIGPGGYGIRAIEAATGSRIDVLSSSSSEGVTVINIAAPTQEAASATWHSIAAAAAPREKPVTVSRSPIVDLSVNLSISVPAERIGTIIGRSGASIRAIEAATGARVRVPRSSEGGGGSMVVITITSSSQEGAAAAWHAVAAAALPQKKPQISSCSTILDDHRIGKLFGVKGTALRLLEVSTGCRITVEPPNSSRSRTIVIVGPEAGAAIAVAHIDSLQVDNGVKAWGADL